MVGFLLIAAAITGSVFVGLRMVDPGPAEFAGKVMFTAGLAWPVLLILAFLAAIAGAG